MSERYGGKNCFAKFSIPAGIQGKNVNTAYQIYFAGDLFNHKDLIGNLLLADAINRHSSGRFQCVLPQNLEQTTDRSIDIRNNDLLEVIKADLILLNFDGSELDSGTVVEFLFAKALDLPAVILRTDFRDSGDQHRGGDPWNLMCSGFPRTEVITLNGMAWYQDAWRKGGSTESAVSLLYQKLAQEVISGFDKVRVEPPLTGAQDEELVRLYQWSLKYPGSGLGDLLDEKSLKQILLEKKKKRVH